MHLKSPFIVENGAAVYIPKTFAREIGIELDACIKTYDCLETTDYIIKVFAKPNTHWQSILADMSHWHSSFKALSKISTDELIKLTGLHQTQAKSAQQRQYGEPLFWLGTDSEKQLFIKGPFKRGTNNIGEFLALVHGIAFLKSKNKDNIPIYSDSKIAINWVKKKQCKTNIVFDSSNKDVLELIKRAEKWLKENTFKNPILKWETKAWGEIPADFGRK